MSALGLAFGLFFALLPAVRAATAAETTAVAAEAQPGGASPAEVDPLAPLRREVAALRSLVGGTLPEGFDVAALFEVDLRDQPAVAARSEALKSELAQLEEQRRELLAQETAVPEPAEAPQKGEVQPKAPQAGKGKKPAPATRPAAPAERAGVPEELELRLERVRLRLAFLQKPVEARLSLLAADEKRRKIADEQFAAEQARVEAEAAARKAEAARQAALEEARSAATAAAKALAAERARAEANRAFLANLRADLAKERQTHAEEAARLLARERELAQRARAPGLKGEEADRIYDGLVSLLIESRTRLGRALDQLDAPSRVLPFAPGLNLDAGPYVTVDGRDALLDVIRAARDDAEQLRTEERENRLREASDLVQAVEAANGLRIELIPRLSAEKRSRVLGLFSREGLAQLGRELTHVALMARWYPMSRLFAWRSLRSQLQDFFAVGTASLVVFKLLALAVLGFYTRRRRYAWLGSLRGLLVKRVTNRSLSLVADRWLRMASAISTDAGLLLFIYAFFWILGPAGAPETAFLRALIFTYAWYRILIAAAHHTIASAAASRRSGLPPELSLRIFKSIRFVGRYGLAVVVVLLASKLMLGRGYLYTVVVRFFWLGAFPLAFVLIRRWRPDITAAYLKMYPSGRFARSVEATQDKPHGFFVAAGAFGTVAAHGLLVYGQEILLRFDQTRRALAFFFRRRLEKQSQKVGLGAVDVTVLPEGLREVFSEDPVDPGLTIPHYPHLDEIYARIEKWRGGASGTAVSMVGERGIGKTSWLAELERRLQGVGVVRLTLDRRLTTAQRVCHHLGETLGFVDTRTPDHFVEAADAGERRVVLLDHGQNLILRAPGGLEGYEAFTELVARTWDRLFWVTAFSKYAWEHVQAVYRGRNLFRNVYRFQAWPEEEIGRLIERRMAAAGFQASYEDLIVERVDGAELENEVVRTGERYRRLLWDYADGNPRVAVHFWLRSLVPDAGERVRVHLFAAPSADELDTLQEQLRFLLAAIVTHENITREELSTVLRFPVHLCESALNYLEAQGFVELKDGRYRVTAHWNRATIRFLRRKHLLFS